MVSALSAGAVDSIPEVLVAREREAISRKALANRPEVPVHILVYPEAPY